MVPMGSQTSAKGVRRRYDTSSTTPTTRKPSPSISTALPTAGWSPKKRCRVVALMAATRVRSSSSFAVKGPPSRKRKLMTCQKAPSVYLR
jgi:hypothetical protein